MTPPSVVAQPQGKTVLIGDNATFSILAAGSLALAYQWRFNGTNLAGATEASFSRSPTQPWDGGSYTIVITNLGGSVTSAPAVLALVSRPSLASPQRLSNGNFSLTVTGTAGFNYLIEGTTNFGTRVSVGTVSNSGGTVIFTDTNANVIPYRFYRARLLP